MVFNAFKRAALVGAVLAIAAIGACQGAITRAEMVKVNALQIKLFKQKDAAGLLKLLADDYTQTDTKGRTISKPQIKTQLAAMFPLVKTVKSASATIVKFAPTKAGCAVVVESKIEFTVAMNGKIVAVRQVSRAEEVWAKVKGKLLAKSAKDLTESLWVDGKKQAIP